MPVHAGAEGGLLVVTVDGDFTVPELERVVEGALRQVGATNPVRALLDLSGSASLSGMADPEVDACVRVFVGRAATVERLAVLVSGSFVEDLMRVGTALVRARDLRAAPFRARDEALAWLSAAVPGG